MGTRRRMGGRGGHARGTNQMTRYCTLVLVVARWSGRRCGASLHPGGQRPCSWSRSSVQWERESIVGQTKGSQVVYNGLTARGGGGDQGVSASVVGGKQGGTLPKLGGMHRPCPRRRRSRPSFTSQAGGADAVGMMIGQNKTERGTPFGVFPITKKEACVAPRVASRRFSAKAWHRLRTTEAQGKT